MTLPKRIEDPGCFEPAGFFALRTPVLPFDELEHWGAGLEAPMCEGESLEGALRSDRALLRARLRRWLDDPSVREAILVASPDLEASLGRWLDDPDGGRGRRVERSIVRYFTRMSTRPTPFGLFAGNSAGRLEEKTRLLLDGRATDRRHARLDMDYLYVLGEALSRDPALRGRLLLRPNSTLYRGAGRVRYVEARLDGRVRSHHLVAVVPTPHLDATLARAASGATRGEMAAPLAGPGVAADEAEAFVDALVESQILVTDLEPQVTGEDPLLEQVRILREQGGSEELALRLEGVRGELEGLDASPPGCDVKRYAAILRSLEGLPAKPDLPYLFQVDLIRSSAAATLGRAVAADVLRAVDLFRGLASRDPNPPLQRFREAFSDRYELREVPLVEALDEEIGIGFDPAPDTEAEPSPLLDGLPFPEPPAAGTRARDARLARLLLRGSRPGALSPVMELSEADIREILTRDADPLPDAFAAMVSIAAPSEAALDAGDYRVFVEVAMGPSGARLLGRFCFADPILRAGVEAHLRTEEALEPGAILAEVAHLPEGRLGNVLCRPVLRSHEIVFLGRSGAAAGRRIHLDDLLVSVAGDRVVLRSRSLGCEILPRLSSAHNYTWRSLGIYRFLCSLQEQGRSSRLIWDWGSLKDAPYLPRVNTGRLVLSRARWMVRSAEMKPFATATGAVLFGAVRSWRSERRIPRLAVLADEDNRLVVDFENVLSVESFQQLVARREEFVLEELFPGPSELIARGPEGRFTHEIVIPFARVPGAERPAPAAPSAVAARPAASQPAPNPARRLYAPGSEWLYAKLYCGRATADLVLREVVTPLLERTERGVTRWFFLRYGDPQWHLRLRLRGEPRFLMVEAARHLERLAVPLLRDGRISRLSLDTYERELERYGGEAGIELAERMFQADSECVLGIVGALEGDEGGEARWRLALRGVDLLLEDLRCTPERAYGLVSTLRDSLARELGAERELELGLARRYRDRRADVEQLFDAEWEQDGGLPPGLAHLRKRSHDLRPVVDDIVAALASGWVQMTMEDLAASMVHLHCNRLLRSAHRAHELVIYDFLARFQASRMARGERGGRSHSR